MHYQRTTAPKLNKLSSVSIKVMANHLTFVIGLAALLRWVGGGEAPLRSGDFPLSSLVVRDPPIDPCSGTAARPQDESLFR